MLLYSLCRRKLCEHIHHILRMHPGFAFVPLVITGCLGLKGRNQRFPTKPVSWSQQFPAASGGFQGLSWSSQVSAWQRQCRVWEAVGIHIHSGCHSLSQQSWQVCGTDAARGLV